MTSKLWVKQKYQKSTAWQWWKRDTGLVSSTKTNLPINSDNFSRGHAVWAINNFSKIGSTKKNHLKGRTKAKTTFSGQWCVNCAYFTILVKKLQCDINESIRKLFFEVQWKVNLPPVLIVDKSLTIHNFSKDNAVWQLN